MLDSRDSMKAIVIAIDGPSGAGKGTVARAIAETLGYRHIDSGAMYRAIAWKSLRDGVALDDEEAVDAMARAVGCAAAGCAGVGGAPRGRAVT